jgi:hypothetical protein
MPDLSKLTTVILGLGIGVIPYGTNQVSAALKSNKQTTPPAANQD